MSTQAMKALEKANELRCGWANERRAIFKLSQGDGCRRAAELLLILPPEVEGVRLEILLGAIYRMGDIKIGAFLRTVPGFQPIRRTRRIRDLSVRERAAVILALSRRADHLGANGSRRERVAA